MASSFDHENSSLTDTDDDGDSVFYDAISSLSTTEILYVCFKNGTISVSCLFIFLLIVVFKKNLDGEYLRKMNRQRNLYVRQCLYSLY